MREIKFRAWSKDDKKMRYHAEQAANGHWQMNDINYFYQLLNNPKYDLMQYTGFTDDSNQEIYEGDILYFEEESEFLGHVYWLDGSYWVSGVNEVLVDWNKACRVAGNIYEDVERYKQLD